MINNYIVKWKIDFPYTDIINEIRGFVYKEASICLSGTFDFKIEGIYTHEENTSFDNFICRTDWLFYPNDRTFNLFYTHSIKDLDLVTVNVNEAKGTKLESKHLYCLPFWMPYMFSSTDESFNQEIVSLKFTSIDRPRLKKEGLLY